MNEYRSTLTVIMVILGVIMSRSVLGADISQCSAVANGVAEVVSFSARLDDGRELSVKGLLTKPTGSGQHPAILILPGDGSLYTPYCHRALARQFNDWGYVVLVVASSTGEDTDGVRQFEYSFFDQANHARGAARYLRGQSFVASERMAVWGHSRAGLTAIELATSSKDTPPPFRTIVAAAPHCPSKVTAKHTPLLLIVGTADRKISVGACRDFAKQSEHQPGFDALFIEGGDHLYWLQPVGAQLSSNRMRRFLSTHLAR